MSVFSLSFSFSYDVRGNGVEIGRHWNDGVNLGARARFENAASAGSGSSGSSSVLWVDDLRDADRGAYRCRVDFRQAPTRNARINLEVIGESMGGQFATGVSYKKSTKLWGVLEPLFTVQPITIVCFSARPPCADVIFECPHIWKRLPLAAPPHFLCWPRRARMG